MNDILLARRAHGDWLRFRHPLTVLSTHRVDEVSDVLQEVDHRVAVHGLFAAGFVCYEAAPGLDAALTTHPPGRLPLVYFALYRAPEVTSSPFRAGKPEGAWRDCTNESAYYQALARIKQELAAGNVYQVNHTVRLSSPAVAPGELFRRFAGDAAYGAYIEDEAFAIMSASPELFFTLDGDRLISKPMKGTAPRGLTLTEDRRLGGWLAGSEKNRAENLMITDMVRNDMGRIARVGSVVADDLFRIERYPTVWQMTSTVAARTQAPLVEIMRALFPGASITGAPKRASMRLIAELEDSPREVYTGCIGYLGPGRQAQFNIAIRTAWTDKAAATMHYGVGGGIVWDSDPREELEEIRLKTQVLTRGVEAQAFELLETMRWVPGQGVYNLSRHLQRLADSAEYFGFDVDREAVTAAIEEATSELGASCCRLRLRVGPTGALSLDVQPLPLDPGGTQMLVLAGAPVDSDNPLLYHKTTNRKIYEEASRGAAPGQEVLLYNHRGFVTESVIANVVYRWKDHLYTPPVSDGLLPGTLRAQLLDQGVIRERQLPLAQLKHTTELYLINSLRGWRRARLFPADGVDDVAGAQAAGNMDA